ncbi:hypothetical protein KAR91_51130 [Candidatus Pacearchaeota archaeon]|nr:hypothetical protein [Candidatus Pacearchaeota archaeon]
MKSRKVQITIDAEISSGGISLGIIIGGAKGEAIVQPHEIVGVLEIAKAQVIDSTHGEEVTPPDVTIN